MRTGSKTAVRSDDRALDPEEKVDVSVFITERFVITLPLCYDDIRAAVALKELLRAVPQNSAGSIGTVIDNPRQPIQPGSRGIALHRIVYHRPSPHGHGHPSGRQEPD